MRGVEGKLVRSGEVPGTTAPSGTQTRPCPSVSFPLWQISSLMAFSRGPRHFPPSRRFGKILGSVFLVHLQTTPAPVGEISTRLNSQHEPGSSSGPWAPELSVNQA